MPQARIKLLIGGRGSGKTHRLIENAIRYYPHSIIFCFNETEAFRLRQQGLKAQSIHHKDALYPNRQYQFVGLDNWLYMDDPMGILTRWWQRSEQIIATTDMPFEVEYLDSNAWEMKAEANMDRVEAEQDAKAYEREGG
ncbi:MAG: hypothetical protein ABID84_00080 [Chloroflexota bacterium]